MPNEQNFLLGFGERLTEPVSIGFRGGPKTYPYSLEEMRETFAPRLNNTVSELGLLSGTECPNDEVVAVVTLHPAFLAKTYFPERLLRHFNLSPIGSRPKIIRPRKWKPGQRNYKKYITSELFIAGTKTAFQEWSSQITQWTDANPVAQDLKKFEDIRAFNVGEKIITKNDWKEGKAEIVLHSDLSKDYILEGFRKHLAGLNIEVNLSKRIQIPGLCFLSLELPKDKLEKVANFSFVRAIRQMPKLRKFDPIIRSVPTEKKFTVELPDVNVVDKNIRVAIFDGGLANSSLEKWTREHIIDPLPSPIPHYQHHGSCVTSAFLFGPLEKGKDLPAPYAEVDHYRVLDDTCQKEEDLSEVLRKITTVLEERHYDFVNLSLGPNLPIEDNEVHMWTAVLDQYFSDGTTLASVAAGNNGEDDRTAKLNRIQVPSDCVNVLSIGSADTLENDWRRSKYSACGPGRHPGVVKPDCLAFGGTEDEPFWVLDTDTPGNVYPTKGTSFASPLALRMATGIRAHLGPSITPLATKALLIHRTEKKSTHRNEIGWGRIPNDINELVLCPPNTANVLYQGKLLHSKWLRAEIPLPPQPLSGYLTISATFCFASETDPQDPLAYTKSGLEIVFRPNDRRIDANGTHPKSKAFFRPAELYLSEENLRKDAHKWETTLYASKRFRASTLNNPVFDIHCHARNCGGPPRTPSSIPYALVISIYTPGMPDVYNKLFQKYRTKLEILQPVIRIPIRH
jgi:Subtilase family